MNQTHIPLVEIGLGRTPDAANYGGATPSLPRLLPELKNYADDETTSRWINDQLLPVLEQARSSRTSLEAEWQLIQNMEFLTHDSGRKYHGRSDAYIPLFNNTLKQRVSQLSRGLFPSDEYLEVTDRGNGGEEQAKKVKGYVQWELETNAQIKKQMKPFLKCLESLGTSVFKVWYGQKIDAKAKKQGRLTLDQLAPQVMGAAPQVATPKFLDCYEEGLKVSPRSLFHWYIWPVECASLEEASLVFEDVPVTKGYVKQLAASGKWLNAEEAYNAAPPSNFTVAQAGLVQVNNDLQPSQNQGDRDLGDVVVLTECWFNMVLPKTAYLPDEDVTSAIPTRVLLANSTLVEVTRNPLYHQQPPYLVSRTNVTAGLFYGYGIGKTIRGLQMLSNDFAAQTNDCAAYTLNPIVKVNPSLLVGQMSPLAPGRVYSVLEKDALTFDRPPAELIGFGSQMISMWTGMAQDYSGTPPVVQGIGAGKAAKTATGAQILQRNATAPLQDEVEDLEADIMVPLAKMAWILGQQYRDQAVMAVVTGSPPMKVMPEDLAIDAQFRWLAANQAVNQAQRAQQVQGFVQMAGPLGQALAMQGKMLNVEEVLKRLWTDGYGFRNFNNIVIPAPPPPGMPPPPPMNPGAGEAPTVDRVRSALESVGGAGVPMVPGEAMAADEVRQNADAISADAGSRNMIRDVPFIGDQQ